MVKITVWKSSLLNSYQLGIRKICNHRVLGLSGDDHASELVDELQQLRAPDVFQVHDLLEVVSAVKMPLQSGEESDLLGTVSHSLVVRLVIIVLDKNTIGQ